MSEVPPQRPGANPPPASDPSASEPPPSSPPARPAPSTRPAGAGQSQPAGQRPAAAQRPGPAAGAKPPASTGAKILTMLMVTVGVLLTVGGLIAALLAPFLQTKSSIAPAERVPVQVLLEGTGTGDVTEGHWIVVPSVSATALSDCTVTAATQPISTKAFADGFEFTVDSDATVAVSCTPSQTVVIMKKSDYSMYSKGYSTPMHPMLLWLAVAGVGLVLLVVGQLRRRAQHRREPKARR